jgi:peptide/nickel transport system substrate-binding protein
VTYVNMRWMIGSGLVSASLLLAGLSSLGTTTAPNGVVMGKTTLTLTGDPPTDPENFNPLSVNDLEGVDFIYEPMYVIDTLTGKATPWLATSYRWVNSKEVQFQIRKGVTWNNGAPLTAEDVAFTFNLMKQYPATDLNDVWGFLQSVTASGDTVTFHLSKVDYPAWEFLANQVIVYPPQFKNVNPVKFTNTHPIGTGPYMLHSFNSDEYTLTVNPTYWQRDKIRVPSITYLAAEGNTIDDLELSEGKYSWSDLFEPGIQKSYVDRNPAYHYWFSTGSPVSLYLNLTEKPFSNVVFRRAIAYAINRNLIYKEGEYGYEPPANQSLLSSGLNAQWLDSSLAKKYTYAFDPSKAQQLLATIGYHKKDGRLIGPNGTQLSFTLQVPSGYTDWIQDTAIIQKELGTLGIKVEVETPSVSTDSNDLDTGHFQAALSGIATESNPYYDYYYQMSGAESAPIGQVTTANTERWNNAQSNQLINELAHTDNLAQEHQLVDQLQQIAFSQLPTIALVYSANWYEYQTNDYVGWPTEKNPYTYPPLYSGTDVLQVITHLRPKK